MANPHPFAIFNQKKADSGIPKNESQLAGLGINC